MLNHWTSRSCVGMAMLVCVSWVFACGADPDLSEVQLVVDTEVIIAPASMGLYSHNMVRGPDESIWINAQTTEPGLLKSTDNGETWTTVSVDTNVISASVNALIDGFEFALIEHAESCMLCDDAF